MTKRLGLSAMQRSTQYAPLAALGAFLQQQDFFAPLWEHVQLGGKTISHEPHQKLLDVVVSMRKRNKNSDLVNVVRFQLR